MDRHSATALDFAQCFALEHKVTRLHPGPHGPAKVLLQGYDQLRWQGRALHGTLAGDLFVMAQPQSAAKSVQFLDIRSRRRDGGDRFHREPPATL